MLAENITRFSKKEKFKYRWDEIYFQTFCQIAEWSDTNDVLKITMVKHSLDTWYEVSQKKKKKKK